MTPIVKYDEAMTAYLRNLRFLGKSPATLRNYESRLSHFRDFWAAKHDGSPEHDPNYEDVLAWRDALMEGGRAASTVRQYLVELEGFFNAFADPIFGEHLAYETNPVSRRFQPVVKKRPYDQILTDDEVKKLLDPICRNPHQKTTWPRNYAIVALLLATKIRNDELLSLTLADLDFENEELTVRHGKGDKYRATDFPAFAQSAVLLYLQSGLRPSALPASAPLFGTEAAHSFGTEAIAERTEKWHKGSSQWLSSLVERHVRNITGVKDVRTHDLRHVGSRLDLNAGCSMESLQSELGHSSIGTTQIYCGRLQTKKGRRSAQSVLAEMDRIAAENMKRYEAQKIVRAV